MDFKQYVKLDEAMAQGSGRGVVGKTFGSLIGGMRNFAAKRAKKKKEDQERGMDPSLNITGPGKLNQPGIKGRMVGAAAAVTNKAAVAKERVAASPVGRTATRSGAAVARTAGEGRAKYERHKTRMAKAGRVIAHPKKRDEKGNVVMGKDGKPERDTTKTSLVHKGITGAAAALATHEGPLRTLVGGSGAPGGGKNAVAKAKAEADAAAAKAANDTSGETRTDPNKAKKETGAA